MCLEKKANLKYIPINQDGELIFEELPKLITAKKIVSLLIFLTRLERLISRKEMIARLFVHYQTAFVLIDGAQAVPHLKPDDAGFRLRFLCI